MRKLLVHRQATLDNRITNAQGAFWEPFLGASLRVAYVNQFFGTAGSVVLHYRAIPD